MLNKNEIRNREIPDIITDSKGEIVYKKGQFLGKGGFAKCFELINQETKDILAGKIIPKDLLVKPSQKEKLAQEVDIHRSLNHKYIVKFKSFFEDNVNMYILLELCNRRSLLELQKRRKKVTEAEARYFIQQIVSAVAYLHGRNIIHRDLKLGNIFLNDNLEVKIGDFGLAIQLSAFDEKRKTMCGTPNYIAPEILEKNGHSLSVDTWSIGCIIYTLIVGNPPFETSSLKETYKRIRTSDYKLPPSISQPAKDIISQCLQIDPSRRPKMTDLLKHFWLIENYIPTGLPLSALSMEPALKTKELNDCYAERLPLAEMNSEVAKPVSSGGDIKNLLSVRLGERESLQNLLSQVKYMLEYKKPFAVNGNAMKYKYLMQESEDPNLKPIYWVSKWVDYSDKYGLGYQLCDESVGVLFVEESRAIMSADGNILQFITKDFKEYICDPKNIPLEFAKKYNLIRHFKSYMYEYLVMAGESRATKETDAIARLPFMRFWMRNNYTIVMHLSNGTLQLNFFDDHTKIILCPLMSAISYIDKEQNFRTFKFSSLMKHGMTSELETRITHSVKIMEQMIAKAGHNSLK